MSDHASGPPSTPGPGTGPDPGSPRPDGPGQADGSSAGVTTQAGPADGLTGAPKGQGINRIILDGVTQGSPAVVTTLAIFLALVVGGLIIAFSDTTVLHAWGSFFSAPGAAISAAWQSVAAAYSALFEGAIVNPHTIAAAFHGGSVGAIFYPLSQTAAQATPLILTGLSVALAFRAGLFNIGAASQWIGGAIVVTYLGFALSLPPVIHVIVCLAGGFAGGAVMGWLVGDLKARTGAHEVIVTIMLNYVMYNLLSYLLGTPSACSCHTSTNLISPTIASDAQLPHVGGPRPQVGAGFLVALAAAAGVWWLLARSTTGFEFRTVGANPSAARTAGMSVERTWVLVMLLAGRSRRAQRRGEHPGDVRQPQLPELRHLRHRRHHRRPARPGPAARGRAGGAAVRRAGRREHRHAGSHVGPGGHRQVIQGLIVLFVAAPPLIRAVFRLRQARVTGMEAVAQGWNG